MAYRNTHQWRNVIVMAYQWQWRIAVSMACWLRNYQHQRYRRRQLSNDASRNVAHQAWRRKA